MENQNSTQTPVDTPNAKDNQTLMGILSYLGILVIIPFLTTKEKPFVKYHIKQGLVLVIIEIILWVGMRTFWPLIPFIGLLELGVLVLVIIGIINVINKKEKELPVVGQFAKHINI